MEITLLYGFQSTFVRGTFTCLRLSRTDLLGIPLISGTSVVGTVMHHYGGTAQKCSKQSMCCVQAAASGWGVDFLKKNQDSVAKANAAVAAAIAESDSAAKGEHLCMNCTFFAQISHAPYRGQPSCSAFFRNIMCCRSVAAAAVIFDIGLQHDLGSVCCPAAAPGSALWAFGKPALESQSASASSGKFCPLPGSCVVMPRMGNL